MRCMFNMKKLFALLFILGATTANAAEKIKVVASIKPLQLVSQAIVADLGQVDVLIPPGGSPHHYSLKPSDVKKLYGADLIVWVGPDLEQFLSKSLSRTDAEKLQLLESDEAAEGRHDDDEHESHEEHAHEGHGHDDHGHHHGDNDPHVWMDPALMVEAAEKLAKQLSVLHPLHKAKLEENYQTFAAELLQTDRAIRQKLLPYQDKGFVVFHDAFALLVAHYGLKQEAYFTVDPARAPGAKRLREIQGLITKQGVSCVFLEPQFEAAVVKALVADLPVNVGRLDPLAIDITAEQGYTGYLQQLAGNIENCLK